jgi:hypothetical protein
MGDPVVTTDVLTTVGGVPINLERTISDANPLVERVWFMAGATIDADGANGQKGGPVAYNNTDTGSDKLANGGMMIDKATGRVVEIPGKRAQAILGADGNPRIYPGGVIGSPTSYKFPGKQADELDAYVDAETVPYVVVFKAIIKGTIGKVMGCRARLTYKGTSVDCVVADSSSGDRAGEISIEAARQLGIPSSPRNGGLKEAEILYEIWPGQGVDGFPWMKS